MTDTPNATTDGQLYMVVYELDSTTVYKAVSVRKSTLGYRIAECAYDLNGNTMQLMEFGDNYHIIDDLALVKLLLTSRVPVDLTWKD